MEEATRALIAKGYNITTTNATFQPVIKGTFARSGVLDEAMNRLSCTVVASKSLMAVLADVRHVFMDQVDSAGGAMIDGVVDAITGRADGTISSGGVISVTGSKIKCVGADGVSEGMVAFLDAVTGDSVATVSTIVHNAYSTLILVFPDLDAGNYVLQVRTHYATGGPLKSEQAVTSGVLTVS